MNFDDPNLTAKKQIRTLLIVLLCAVASAGLLGGYIAFFYGPSGNYGVKNTLISPELLPRLAYNDTNNRTGGESRFIFDGIELSTFDRIEKKTQSYQIDLEKYRRFYEAIVNDKSLSNPGADLIGRFNRGDLINLAIKVRTESHAEWQDERKTFQRVDFIPDGDYYRIELHEEKALTPWVYFFHHNIAKEALQIFIPST